MIYKGIVKERDVKRKAALFAAGLIILYLSYEQRNFLYMAMAVVLIAAIFFEKQHIISEEGVIIDYKLFAWRVQNKWEWSQITAIRPNFKKAKPNILLEIAKDVTIRPFVFEEKVAWEVLAFAKKMNPDMYVDDRTPEQQREDTDEMYRRLDEQQMRRIQQKRSERARAKAKKRK